MSSTVRTAIITGVALGVVAAVVVWWLERFELAKLHTEVADYLGSYERFKLWEREHGGPPGE